MTISNYAENKFLDTLRNVSFSVPGTWVKLHTEDPGEECILNNAANDVRIPVTFSSAANGSIVSTAPIVWNSVSNSETYRWFSLWDNVGPVAGNALWKGQLSSPAQVATGDIFQILTLTLTLE